jgi:hypothetical protein
MTADEYEKLPLKEKEHFAICAKCGEIFDRRPVALDFEGEKASVA